MRFSTGAWRSWMSSFLSLQGAGWVVLACTCIPPPHLEADTVDARSLPDAREGERYEYGVVVQGLVEPYSLSWQKDELPPGLKVSGALIHGTPSESRTQPYVFTMVIRDALDLELQATFVLRVRPTLEPLTLATTALPTFLVGEDVEFPLAAQGGEGRYRWKAVGHGLSRLGLRLELEEKGETCLLLGKARSVGDYRIEVVLADSLNQLETKVLSGRIRASTASDVTILTKSLATATYRIPWSAPLRAGGGTPPYVWNVQWEQGKPPSGLSFDAEHQALRGIGDRLGSFPLSVRVRDSLGDEAGPTSLTVTVAPQPLSLGYRCPLHHLVFRGEPCRIPLSFSGAQGFLRWTANWAESTAPQHLSIREIDGELELAGTPDESGTFKLNLTATDWDRPKTERGAVEISNTGPHAIVIEVLEPNASPLPLELLTHTLPSAIRGQPYRTHLAARGGRPPLLFHLEPTRDAEVTLSPEGELAFTPARTETIEMEVRVTDRDRQSCARSLRFDVLQENDSELAVPELTPQVGVMGRPFQLRVPVCGGTPPYQTQLLSTPPAGLQMNREGVLKGKPEQPGTYSLEFVVEDGSGTSQQTKVPLEIVSIGTGLGLALPWSAFVLSVAASSVLLWLRHHQTKSVREDSNRLQRQNEAMKSKQNQLREEYQRMKQKLRHAVDLAKRRGMQIQKLKNETRDPGMDSGP